MSGIGLSLANGNITATLGTMTAPTINATSTLKVNNVDISTIYAPATGSTVYAPATGSTAYAPATGSTVYAPISGSANYAPATGSTAYAPQASPMFSGTLTAPAITTGTSGLISTDSLKCVCLTLEPQQVLSPSMTT